MEHNWNFPNSLVAIIGHKGFFQLSSRNWEHLKQNMISCVSMTICICLAKCIYLAIQGATRISRAHIAAIQIWLFHTFLQTLLGNFYATGDFNDTRNLWCTNRGFVTVVFYDFSLVIYRQRRWILVTLHWIHQEFRDLGHWPTFGLTWPGLHRPVWVAQVTEICVNTRTSIMLCSQCRVAGEDSVWDDAQWLCSACYVQVHGCPPPASRTDADLEHSGETDAEERHTGSADSTPLVISTLQHLLQIKHNVAGIFVASIANIFRYSVKDISDILSQLHIDQLNSTHKLTFTELCNTFPLYKTRNPKQRRVKDTLFSDIITMECSLANGSPSKDLDKVLSESNEQTNSPDEICISELSFLLQKVQLMGVQLRTLTVKVESLELENQQLKDDILALESSTTECAAVPDRLAVNPQISGQSTSVKTIASGSPGTADIPTASDAGPVSPDLRSDESDSEGFIPDRSGRRRQRRRRQSHGIQPPAADTTGASTSTANMNIEARNNTSLNQTSSDSTTSSLRLHAARQSASVYVGRLDSSHTEQEIQQDVELLGVRIDKVKLLARSPIQGSSFKVVNDKDGADKVLSSSVSCPPTPPPPCCCTSLSWRAPSASPKSGICQQVHPQAQAARVQQTNALS